MLTVDLALITYGADGIKRVGAMNLPVIEGVRYIVSWQQSSGAEIPEGLCRPDVEIFRTDTRGAAINRNNAIDRCTADIILFSDDDLVYTPSQIESVRKVFEEHPEVDLATFSATHPGAPKYPLKECRLSEPLPKGYWVSAYQIAYRRIAVGDLRCHPEFGAGAPKFAGADDELFLLAAIRRGLVCKFFPINICTHPDLSTGTTERLSPGNMRATGCYMRIANPRTFFLRLPLKALRIARAGQSGLFVALSHLIAGAAAAPTILRSPRKYLW